MFRNRLVVTSALSVVVVLVLGVLAATVFANDGDPPDSSASARSATPSTPAPTATEKPEKVASVPGEVLNLDDWKITLPIGPQDDANEVEQPDLGSFVKRPFFRVNRDGTGVVFRAPAGGATTSGSDYPRSELREMTAGGTQEASWSNASGKHVMTITQAITDAPKAKSHVVAGQIHDAEDDVVMIRLEDKRLFVEADGDDIGVLDRSYELGTTFTVKIRATPAGIKVIYDDTKVVKYDKVGAGYYFKAGCYTQSNPEMGDAPKSFGQVVIDKLKVTHKP